MTHLGIVREEDVLSLDIPVNDLAGVEVGQPAQHLPATAQLQRGPNSDPDSHESGWKIFHKR